MKTSDQPAVTLFCPECSHGVSGNARELAAPRRCEGCGKEVALVDYSREAIVAPPNPKQTPSVTWADQLIRGLALTAVGLGLAVLGALWSGSSTLALWGSVGCLAAALPLAFRFGTLQRELLRTNELLKRTERTLVISNAKIEKAAQINRGYQKNIERVAEEERRRIREQCNEQLSRIAEKHEDAEWRSRRADDQQRVVRALGDRILNEALERVSIDLSARNFEASRRRLLEVVEFCRTNNYPVTPRREEDLMSQLTHRYNQELRREQERQRRDAVAARLQAERRAHEQMETEITRVEAHRSAIRRRLSEAEAAGETAESSSTTLKRLKSELKSAEEKAKQATSMARHAKAGHVLVLSNVGSFGEGVLKICLSRQVDPLETVAELSRESTPYPFDVHMIVSSDLAAELLRTLHESLHACRINRVDLGKDFFRVDVERVWNLVVANHGTVDCQLVAPAEEFRESRAMSDDRFLHVTQQMQTRQSWSDDADEL